MPINLSLNARTQSMQKAAEHRGKNEFLMNVRATSLWRWHLSQNLEEKKVFQDTEGWGQHSQGTFKEQIDFLQLQHKLAQTGGLSRQKCSLIQSKGPEGQRRGAEGTLFLGTRRKSDPVSLLTFGGHLTNLMLLSLRLCGHATVFISTPSLCLSVSSHVSQRHFLLSRP